jgi:hypothetical protein
LPNDRRQPPEATPRCGQPIRMSGLWERRDARIVQPERR